MDRISIGYTSPDVRYDSTSPINLLIVMYRSGAAARMAASDWIYCDGTSSARQCLTNSCADPVEPIGTYD